MHACLRPCRPIVIVLSQPLTVLLTERICLGGAGRKAHKGWACVAARQYHSRLRALRFDVTTSPDALDGPKGFWLEGWIFEIFGRDGWGRMGGYFKNLTRMGGVILNTNAVGAPAATPSPHRPYVAHSFSDSPRSPLSLGTCA